MSPAGSSAQAPTADAAQILLIAATSVFRAKRPDRIEIVWWDGSGLCLFAERLEHSYFCWPTAGSPGQSGEE
ncbi:IS66 family insertion sequence element accessory protein TnpB [Methylosinus sp. Sm6]|nr:IS66 family insertion sequence element accessory protein TnpB [Methylosinus sp. Sm6]